MDAQLNIKDKVFVSAIYQQNSDNARTSYDAVCSSNRSRETQLALDLLKQEYLNHFDYVVILCPTIRHNEMYLR